MKFTQMSVGIVVEEQNVDIEREQADEQQRDITPAPAYK